MDADRYSADSSTRTDGRGQPVTDPNTELREAVRARYAAAATAVAAGGGCCDSAIGAIDEGFGGTLYPAADRGRLPIEAVGASLGCGNPTAVVELRPGDSGGCGG